MKWDEKVFGIAVELYILKKKLVLNIFYVFYFFNLKFFDVFLSKKYLKK
jgi:hypothetical protein